jgi:hypothetical protein
MFYKQHFDHRLDMLELYLTVRDPGTAKSAEAYDGLRKLLINSNKGTQIHLAHLAEIHRVASAADSLEPVLAKVGEFMNQVGLMAVVEPVNDELFEITGGKGSVAVVDSPAYVSTNGSDEVAIVMRGAAHYEEQVPSAPESVDPVTDAPPTVVLVEDAPVEAAEPNQDGETP